MAKAGRVFLAFILTVSFANNVAWSADPMDPEVKAMVEKAVEWLRGDMKEHAHADKPAGQCLRAYAILKYYKRYQPDVDPTPKEAVVKKGVADAKKAIRNVNQLSNYDLGVILTFLLELDVDLYGQEIDILLKAMLKNQQSHGGWTYPDAERGDTSQTQYAVLSLFTAKKYGFEIKEKVGADVTNWLMRTQDISGSWGYHGRDNGSFERRDQSLAAPGHGDSNHNDAESLAAAGLGSLYICANMMGYTNFKTDKAKEKKIKMIGAAKQVLTQEAGVKTKGQSALVNGSMLFARLNDGDNWFRKKGDPTETKRWQYYYLYTLERYRAFKEIKENNYPKEPAWYNNGVAYLKKEQKGDGRFAGRQGGSMVCTSMAVLFLVRSTKLVVKPIVDADFAGGKGLPDDTSNAYFDENGKLIAPEFAAGLEGFDQFMKESVSINADELAKFPETLKMSEAEKKKFEWKLKVKKMLSAKDYGQRKAAIQAVVDSQDAMDQVPALIYALTDPDKRIVIDARDALRFLSRRFNGVGLPDKYSKEQRSQAETDWRTWYKTVRPDATDF